MRVPCLLIGLMIGWVNMTHAQPYASIEEVEKVHDFIAASWEKTIRFSPEDKGTLIGLPYRYTVPSISDSFQEMYYWDTFFTGEGLIADGHIDLARSNVENMLYIVSRYGKMLNGNRAFFENRSQPPYLSKMVEHIYRKTLDKEWLRKVVPGLKKEYLFWMTRRLTSVGLNRYSNEATSAEKKRILSVLQRRLGDKFREKTEGMTDGEQMETASHYIAECESGWDFSPRFQTRCEHFCPIDLNANLYGYEKNFEFFAKELGSLEEARQWHQKAEHRKTLIRKHCREEKSGLYYDYDFVNGKRSDVVSAAVFSLLFNEVLSRKDAQRMIPPALQLLEFQYGISACENKDYGVTYQWSYPNGWAPLNYLAVSGLDRYGYKEEALRMAKKYQTAVVNIYKATGNLWEKYNVNEGNVNVVNEYKLPTMLGWTAGTFVWISQYLTSISPVAHAPKCFTGLPRECNPEEIGLKLSERFLKSGHMSKRLINYPEVCTWYGALRFSDVTGNEELQRKLEARFQPLYTTENHLFPKKNHVDFNMFGCLPLELYKLTGNTRYYEIGMSYADTQWDVPQDATPLQKSYTAKGFSWQTRMWIDDMFMITILQSKAYQVTGDSKYIDRAAREMVLYLDSLQQPNGLFYHAPDVPFYWARGNGWFAVGMAELLSNLPENHSDRPRILKGYLNMMHTLKKLQNSNGTWYQLVDKPDTWVESSGSAMFVYAMIQGVRNQWLDEKKYGEAARKGWIGLVPYINADGDVTEVCIGTGKKNDLQFYYDRPRVAGDFHGQAPMLWCAYTLAEIGKMNTND